MKKKGFTLVELLAVIAILAILVIIALPNVLKMFNDAKERAFTTELREIYKTAQQQWIADSMFSTGEKEYVRCSTCTGKELDMSGRRELEYYIKLDKSGNVITYKATDGSYQYSYTGTGLKIENIKNVVQISKIEDESDIISISNNGATGGETGNESNEPSTLTPSEIAQLNLRLSYHYTSSPVNIEKVQMIIDNSSTLSNLNEVQYEIYYSTQPTMNAAWTEKEHLTTIVASNKSQNFFTEYYINRADVGFKIFVDAYVGGQKVLSNEISKAYCFVAGTKVLTENGYKNIELINKGEKVYSYNLNTNELELKLVTGTIVSSTNKTIIIKINGKELEMSERHELYIIDKGWVRAYDLEVGDEMLDSNGKVVKIENIKEKYYEKEIPIYNLTVDGNHNYFVTDIQVLVHNASSPHKDPPQITP